MTTMKMKTLTSMTLMGVALGTAIVLAGMAAAQAQPIGAGSGMHREHRLGGEHMGGHGGHGGAHRVGQLLDAAGASPEQRAKLQQIMKSAHDDLRQQHQAGRASQHELARLLSSPQLDAVAVEAARQRAFAQREASNKRMTQAMFDASAVLTPEQRQKVAGQMNLRREMMERHQRERQALHPGPRS